MFLALARSIHRLGIKDKRERDYLNLLSLHLAGFALLDQKVPWETLKAVIEKSPTEQGRTKYSRFATIMYIGEGRFEEAKLAAEYWHAEGRKLVRGQRKEGYAALEWERIVKNQSEAFSPEEAREYHQRAQKSLRFRDFKTSRIAVLSLLWVERQENFVPQMHRLRQKRFICLGLPCLNFDESFARALGMDSTTYKGIAKEAEKIDF